jgi:hypothetical protein
MMLPMTSKSKYKSHWRLWFSFKTRFSL